ncbi:hypothetical protein ABZ342_26355 [Amycolatopsis sp. NPDC005961]|uniref:hypothetical protein n=1 Tax=Amycolatopsis sp. NPDC005961 TaxID=3156720 RepID=UPI003404F24A
MNAASHGSGAAFHSSATSWAVERRPANARYSSCAGAVSVAVGRPTPTVHREPPVVRRRNAGRPRPATDPENPRTSTSKLGAQAACSTGGGTPSAARRSSSWV